MRAGGSGQDRRPAQVTCAARLGEPAAHPDLHIQGRVPKRGTFHRLPRSATRRSAARGGISRTVISAGPSASHPAPQPCRDRTAAPPVGSAPGPRVPAGRQVHGAASISRNRHRHRPAARGVLAHRRRSQIFPPSLCRLRPRCASSRPEPQRPPLASPHHHRHRHRRPHAAYRVVAQVRNSHRRALRPHRHITTAAVRPPIGSLLTGPERSRPAAHRTAAYKVVAHVRDSQHPARRPHRHTTTGALMPPIGSLLTDP